MPDCDTCNDLRKENGEALLTPMDPSQDECLNCPLFAHQHRFSIPEGCEHAWAIAQWLAGPAIERFNLAGPAVELLDLGSLEEMEFVEIIQCLNGICEGENAAQKIIHAPKKSGKGK